MSEQKRRKWTAKEKLRIVLTCLQPGVEKSSSLAACSDFMAGALPEWQTATFPEDTQERLIRKGTQCR